MKLILSTIAIIFSASALAQQPAHEPARDQIKADRGAMKADREKMKEDHERMKEDREKMKVDREKMHEEKKAAGALKVEGNTGK